LTGDSRAAIESAFTHFPVLTTDRLRIRQIQPSDADAFFVIRSDPEVRYPYGEEPYQSISEAHAMIQRLQNSYAQHDSLFWCITLKREDTAIGSCCFWNFSSNLECAEIGYELGRSFWRKGFAREAIRAIITHGFTTFGFHRIEANPLAANTPSRNLLLKLGFTYEGNLRERVSFRGRFEDQHFFGLLRNEWLESV